MSPYIYELHIKKVWQQVKVYISVSDARGTCPVRKKSMDSIFIGIKTAQIVMAFGYIEPMNSFTESLI